MRYFVVSIKDLTCDMLCKCVGTNNPYSLRQNTAETQVIIKFKVDTVSLDLFRLGYTAMTKVEILSYLADTSNGFTTEGEI